MRGGRRPPLSLSLSLSPLYLLARACGGAGTVEKAVVEETQSRDTGGHNERSRG
jgi:hypothetical protein